MWQGKLLERKENQQIQGNHPAEDNQGREDRKKKTNSFYYSLESRIIIISLAD